ncbi:hypothetical protein ACFWUW_09435 [Streptomyces sp. NPDC058655]
MTRARAPAQETAGEPSPLTWRITSGSPVPEEVAAVAVALSAAMVARLPEAVRDIREEEDVEREIAARWSPAAGRRRAATSRAAATRPSWRTAP